MESATQTIFRDIGPWIARLLSPWKRDLGRATDPEQISRIVNYLIFYMVSDRIFYVSIKNFLPSYYKELNEKGKVIVPSALTSVFHAVGVSAAGVWFLLNPDKFQEIIKDKAQGWSDFAANVFAFSSAFFLFDIIVILRSAYVSGSIEMLFLLHHFISFAAYVIAQYPYGQLYGILLLLFECSTPLLSLRTFLLYGGYKGTDLVKTVERVFGYSFVLVRVIFGLPLAAAAIYDTILHRDRAPSQFHYWFMLGVISLLTLMNLFWTKIFLAKRKKYNGEKKSKQDLQSVKED